MVDMTYEEQCKHLAGILLQMVNIGYTDVEVLSNMSFRVSGKYKKDFVIELPLEFNNNLFSALGIEKRSIVDALNWPEMRQGLADYFHEKEQNKERACYIRHNPNILYAVQSKKGGQYIATLNGIVKANDGDWIITGVNGEQYPCDQQIFNFLYTIVKEIEENKK